MKFGLIFDSRAIDKNFSTGWGISFLIDENFLFDTGEKGSFLLNNLKNLNFDLKKIKKIFISHQHWDHTGGLWEILKETKAEVFICKSFSKEFKEKIISYGSNYIEIEKFKEIEEGFYTTGEMEGLFGGNPVFEHSLILKKQKGLVLVTGCAHPGILEIAERVKGKFKEEIDLLIGGFHLMEFEEEKIKNILSNLKNLNIKRVCPIHCSGEISRKFFEEEFGSAFVDLKVGQFLEI
ncbi:MAG: MBL fold metallo-hydrolase [Thermoanaerobaculia bacterium]